MTRDRVLEALDAGLIASVDARLAEAAHRAGERLACRLGCDECCIGPFPISALDARRLGSGLAALSQRDPARAARVRARAREAVGAMDDLPGDRATGALDADENARDAFLERHAALPCPALDPDSRGCDLYAWRPLSCRSYGPPVSIGGEALAPCRLCFDGAPQAEIEACRVDPDPEDQEGALLLLLAEPGGEPAETLVAWALAAGGDAR